METLITEVPPWYRKKRYALSLVGAALIGSVMLSGSSSTPVAVDSVPPEITLDIPKEVSIDVPTAVAETIPADAAATQTAAAGTVRATSAPVPVAKPAPKPAPTPTKSCHPSYSGCLDPNASDYDCAGGSGNGPRYTGPVRVTGYDEYDLDRDGDGYACE